MTKKIFDEIETKDLDIEPLNMQIDKYALKIIQSSKIYDVEISENELQVDYMNGQSKMVSFVNEKKTNTHELIRILSLLDESDT